MPYPPARAALLRRSAAAQFRSAPGRPLPNRRRPCTLPEWWRRSTRAAGWTMDSSSP